MTVVYLFQNYTVVERTVHEYSLRGMYRDGAGLQASSFLSKEWWVSRRFFWERGLNESPHCVVFVFDGSSEPFLEPEGLEFFKDVFEDCTKMGKRELSFVCKVPNLVCPLPEIQEPGHCFENGL